MPAKEILELINANKGAEAWRRIRLAKTEGLVATANAAAKADKKSFFLAESYLFSEVVQLFFSQASPNFSLFFVFLGHLTQQEASQYIATMHGVLNTLRCKNEGLYKKCLAEAECVKQMPFVIQLLAFEKGELSGAEAAALAALNEAKVDVAIKRLGLLVEDDPETTSLSKAAKAYFVIGNYAKQDKADPLVLVRFFCAVPACFVESFLRQFPAFFPKGIEKFSTMLSAYFSQDTRPKLDNNLLRYLILLHCFYAEDYREALTEFFYQYQRFYTKHDVMIFASTINAELAGVMEHLGGLSAIYPRLVQLYQTNVNVDIEFDAATALIVSQAITGGEACLPVLIDGVSLEQLPFIFDQILGQSKAKLSEDTLKLIIARADLSSECLLQFIQIVQLDKRCPKKIADETVLLGLLDRFLLEHVIYLDSYKAKVILPLLKVLSESFPRELDEMNFGDKVVFSHFRTVLQHLLQAGQSYLPLQLRQMQPASSISYVLWAFFHSAVQEYLATLSARWSVNNLQILFSDQRLEAVRRSCGVYPGVVGVAGEVAAAASVVAHDDMMLIHERVKLRQLGLDMSLDYLRNLPACTSFLEEPFIIALSVVELPEILCLLKAWQETEVAAEHCLAGPNRAAFVKWQQALLKVCQRHFTTPAVREFLIVVLKESVELIGKEEGQAQAQQSIKALHDFIAQDHAEFLKVMAQVQVFFAETEISSFFQKFMQAMEFSEKNKSETRNAPDFILPSPYTAIEYDDDIDNDGASAAPLPTTRRRASRVSQRPSMDVLPEENEKDEEEKAMATNEASAADEMRNRAGSWQSVASGLNLLGAQVVAKAAEPQALLPPPGVLTRTQSSQFAPLRQEATLASEERAASCPPIC